jgi:hypothetical protein
MRVGPGKTKITYKYSALFVDQNICGLNVTMYNVHRMDIVYGAEHVIEECYEMLFCH